MVSKSFKVIHYTFSSFLMMCLVIKSDVYIITSNVYNLFEYLIPDLAGILFLFLRLYNLASLD